MKRLTLKDPESKSEDLIKENIEQLQQIFPEVIKEGKVDLEALNDLLGNYADTPQERFALNWAGKANARREAQKMSTGTLRPCPEDSVDWDNTQNLYIEGDNLEVLKLLQKSYHNKVKMIYIDPPYNTGNDFVYKDNYKDNMKNYLEQTKQDKKTSTNTESDGRYHSNWLNMMYPRLKLARNLLTEDGVIFISIDDNEQDNLKKVCNEIFGEENFVFQIAWRRTDNQPNIGLSAKVKEYILTYAKSYKNMKLGRLPLSKSALKEYRYKDNYAVKFRRGILLDKTRGRHSYPVKTKSGKILNGPWMITEEKFKKLDESGGIYWTTGGDEQPYSKIYLKDSKGVIPNDFWGIEYGTNQRASLEVEALFEKRIFDFPKPVSLIQSIINIGAPDENPIILDFFAGSCTTGQAIMQLNAKDGGKRKYICVQLPEQTPEDSTARKNKYITITEIGKERIRLAGKKILEELKAKEDNLFDKEEQQLDIGFKVFKLDSSNLNSWDVNPDDLEVALQTSMYNIKNDRTEDDLLYEILLKYGIPLDEEINIHTIAGKKVYEMGAGSLIICLDDNLTSEIADGIVNIWNNVKPEGADIECRVIFKDEGFNGSDEIKANVELILKQHGITNVASI